MGDKTPITREQYDQLIRKGYSDAEIAADGLVLAPTNVTTAQGTRQAADQYDPGRKLAQNIPLVGPWMDEAEGAMQGVGGYVADKLRGKPTSLKGRVNEGMRATDASVRETRRQQGPFGEMADAVLGFSGGNAALKSGSKIARVAAGEDLVTPAAGFGNWALRNASRIGTGAVGGGVMAAGAARQGQKENAAAGGVMLGAGLSAIPAVVEGVQAGKRKVDQFFMHKGPVNRAHSELLNTMEPDELLNRVAGKPQFPGETVADVAATSPSNYTDQLLRGSVSVPSSRGGQIKREMAERAAGRGTRIEESLTKNSGLMAEQPEVTKRMVDEVTKPNVRSAYKAALKPKKALDSDELRAVLDADDPAIAKAKSFAMNKMRERRIPSAKKPFLTDGKDVAMWQTADYNAPFIDYTKRGLDSQIRAAIRTDRLDDAAAIIATRNRLVNEADKLIPGYAEARAVDEGRRAITNAMELGRRLGRGTVDVRDAEAMLQKIVPSSQDFADEPMIRQMFQRGVADGMRRRMGRAADGVKAINAIVGNPNAKEVSRLAFPDETTFQAFEKQLADEMRQIPGEAMTRGARVDPQFLATDAFGHVSPWSVKQAATGEPMLMAAQMAGTLSGQFKKKAGEQTAAALTDMARAKIGTPQAQEVARGVRRQKAFPMYQAKRAARQREGGSELSANLPRLFQQFLLSQNK